MADSSREPDAHRANREAAKLHPSTKTSFRRWVGQRELEGTWRKHLGRRSGSLSRRELVLQEALARQMEVLHHLSQILIINRQGCTSLPRKVIMQRTKLSSIV
jgi:hypothetical protein